MADLAVPGLDLPLRWLVEPEASHPDTSSLELRAPARSDLFTNPPDGSRRANAPAAVSRFDGDFQLRARVTVDFRSTYDAGVLLLWADDERWAKLCFEYSPDGEPMVVSVVTRGRSDDANAFVVDGTTVWLRAARLGDAFAFHASLDGRRWRFVRHFALDVPQSVEIGFLAQAPTGDGCRVQFDEIELTRTRLTDLRDGT
jgi:regulation of enolase protein 1 (concanavalin A-like superfamily)